MKRILLIFNVARLLGFRACALYFLYKLKIKTGYFRVICPASEFRPLQVEVLSTASSPLGAFGRDSLRLTGDASRVLKSAKLILEDFLPYFSSRWFPRPPSWRTHPLTKYVSPLVHWSQTPDFDPAQGDIKYLWEASRFDWAWILARAFVTTQDPVYENKFWFLLQDWMKNNPPQLGVHWRDGQEISLRSLNLIGVSGIFDFRSHPEVWSLVVQSLERVEQSLEYALSQNNNHGLSEAAALYVGGCALPQHRRASHWRRRGLKLLKKQILSQFDGNGWYVQHSPIYARLALRLAFICLRIARERGEHFEKDVEKRLQLATELLYQLQDPVTGRLPNYGANDGTNFFSMSSADYLDFRPVLQTLYYALTQKKLYGDGAHDEELKWFFPGMEVELISNSVAKTSYSAKDSGVFSLQHPKQASHAFIRCHSYSTRPAHADNLHLDLWWNGVNVLRDSGTYQYFDANDWSLHFKATRAHNTLVVGGKSQMREISRFLWADWMQAKVLDASHPAYFEGEHSAYQREFGVVHRRKVEALPEGWRVDDSLKCSKSNESISAELMWHLPGDFHWQLETASRRLICQELNLEMTFSGDGFEVEALSGETNYPLTAESLYYGELKTQFVVRLRASRLLVDQVWTTKIRQLR